MQPERAMQSESATDSRTKEIRQHREEEQEGRVQRRHRKTDEKLNDRERPKNPERDRHADRERGDIQEHRTVKEKAREGDEERPHVSERHRTKDRDKTRDRVDSGEKPMKEYGTSNLSREERKLRDSLVLEKSKHRSEDRERRHPERRIKEGRERESMQSESGTDRRTKERRHHREEEQEGRVQRRHSKTDEKINDRERPKNPERDRHADRERGDIREHRREKEKAREGDKERPHVSERHRTKDRERTRERVDSGEKPMKEYGTSNLSREERKLRDSLVLEESKRRSEDRERRHLEGRKREEVEETLYNTEDAANNESTNYEEDFEDYDDDFEDESEGDKATDKAPEPRAVSRSAEIEEIRKAMLLENESISAVSAAHTHEEHGRHNEELSSEGRNSTPRKSAQRGAFIDFRSAKERQVSGQVSNNQKKRSLEILRLIDLDFSSTFSLLNLPPVKEYEIYIRNFGKNNTKQAYVQCNEDAVDREIQTEEIDLEEKWTQHPGEGAVVCGGHKTDTVQDSGVASKVDSQRLTTFLCSACQVITVLLEENHAERQSNYKAESKEPCLSISDSCFHLNTSLPFLQGRSVYQLQFSEAQRHLLLTVHGLSHDTEFTSLREKHLICVWNIWQPSTPQKILICQSEVTCCCFSPGKASLLFAGTVDGSLLVWDLREELRMHHTMMIEDTNWTFRFFTFSTDGIFAQVNHTHPITAIEPVPNTETKDRGMSSLSSPEEMSGLSFQVASLDESGHLILWVVVELRKVDVAGSLSDLGLIPGGKVKLIHSSCINLSDKFYHRDVLALGIPQTLNMKFLPRDFNHFVIGTDVGIVAHGTRYGLMERPLQYTSLHRKLIPAHVTAIDFSLFGVAAFLAGCSDGSIRLHTMSTELPAMQWNDSTNDRSVTALQWSFTRPTVFFVLDAASSIYIWDLLQNDFHPIAKESLTPDRVLSMSVFGEPEKNSNIIGLALGKSSGKVEIHYIKKKIAKNQPQELEMLRLKLLEMF